MKSLYATEISLDRVVMGLLGLFYLLFYESHTKVDENTSGG